MKKIYTYILNLTLFLSLGLVSGLNAQRLITHDFNDGKFEPYEVNKADQESRVKIKSNSVETHWQQELYNGTNSGRKAQIRPVDDIIFTQHIWMGLKLKIHGDYMKENTNTNAGLMQIWGKNDATGAANHMCMLKFDGRNGGALVWQHRYNSVANKTHYLVEPNFPRDEFVDVIVHVQLKTKNTGIVQVWINGELKIDKTNQNIGWGDMDESGMINETYCFGTSIGQYNFFADANLDDAYDGDDHLFDGHMVGETRTVSYDNVSLYNGVDGYDLVDPSEETTSCVKSTSKTEAECYDAMSGIQTQESSEGTDNVGWIQDGDWTSYENIDLTGMNSVNARVATPNVGGAIEVRLGSETGTLIGAMDVVKTSDNQVYETVSVNIEKTDGVQDVYLVYTGGTGYLFNINWFGFSEEELVVTNLKGLRESSFSVFPNPTSGLVQFSEEVNYQVTTSLGQKVVSGEGVSIDLSNQLKGIYILQVEGESFKIIKK